MIKASCRERESPDSHSVAEKPPDRKSASRVEQGEWYSRGYLPHRDNETLTQHVTVHLYDSLPEAAIEKVDLAIKLLPESRRKIERRKRLEALVDAGHGSCVLAIPDIAVMVQDTLLHFHQERYYLSAWAVMPNHFHSLFQPINGWTLAKIVASWKKFTARRIREYCKEVGAGTFAAQEIRVPGGRKRKKEPVWHPEYWDRYIRDEEHYLYTVEYIHNNPVKAGLVGCPEDWPWSSARFDDTGYGY